MVHTLRVPSTDFDKDVVHYQDTALTRTIIITRNGLDSTVMISAEEYNRLMRRDRQVFASGELPDDIIDAIATSEMDPRHAALDSLIKDWKP